MFFVSRKKKGRIGNEERLLIKLFLNEGWSVPHVKDILRKYFDYTISLQTLYGIRDDFRLENHPMPEIETQAKEVIDEIKKNERVCLTDEIQKTQVMRLAVDARIMEQVENSDRLSLKTLNSLADTLFKREQLLAGKPTSIAGQHKEMSDDELKKYLKELINVEIEDGQYKALAEADSERIDEEEAGGADQVLQAAPQAEEVSKKQS